MTGELTPTMHHLREAWLVLRSESQKAEEELEHAGERKARAEHAYEKKLGELRTFALANGDSYNVATAKARAGTTDELLEMRLAETAYTNCENKVRLLCKQLETITSQGHAYNRELRTFDG